MRVSLPSLSGHLKQELHPVYHLFGAETLLVEEAVDSLRTAALEAGYQERLRFTSEPGFDWNVLLEQTQSLSLFAEKKLIELRLPTGKPGDAGAKAIMDYADNTQNNDTILLIISGPIEKRAQNSKWFKSVDAAGVVVECPTIRAEKLPDWISDRMRKSGLSFEMEAVERLTHYVEGNLLAAAQEVNLLSLLYPQQKITAALIEGVIADHARFNVYHFVDACLSGSANRSIRILQSLKREQVEPVVILWALSRDTRTLCHLLSAMDQGAQPQSLFQRYGIWSSRSGLVNSALRRLSTGQCFNLLRKLGRIDLMVKGRAPLQKQDIWEEIESVALGLCGIRIS